MFNPYFFVFLAALLGLIVGSFLNVCIYRIPLGKYEPVGDPIPGSDSPNPISISEPKRSFCPHCRNQLLWWHNIPILSWIILKGKCHFCKASIPIRYPIVELLTAIAAALLTLRFGPTFSTFVLFVFACALIVITYIDFDYMIIPDIISLPGTAIGVGIGVAQSIAGQFNYTLFTFPIVSGIKESLLGVLLGAGVLYFFAEFYIWLRKKDGLGLGDVKLLALIGALLGPYSSYFTILFGSLIAILIMAPLMLIRRGSLKHYLPFGPFLAIAAFAYVMGVGDSYFEVFRGSQAPAWWITSGTPSLRNRP